MIPLCRPRFENSEIDAVREVLESGLLVQGTNVAALEESFSDYLQISNAIAVSSGTAALHLALVALGVGPGDEVVVPAFSFVATANVVELVGATPVFVDIDVESYCLNPTRLEAAVTSKTAAVVVVHEFGQPADLSPILDVTAAKGIPLIEDAACSIGSRYQGKLVGTLGTVGCFSLHPRKVVTSGEGGVLVTSDNELAKTLRILRNHGIDSTDGTQRFVAAGFNYRLTEMQAVLATGQLARLESSISMRAKLAARYQTEFAGIELFSTPREFPERRHNWQTYHVLLSDKQKRDRWIEELQRMGIGSNYGAQCIPELDFYQSRYRLSSEELFPNAFRSYRSGLALPLFENLEEDDASKVIDCVQQLVAKFNAH